MGVKDCDNIWAKIFTNFNIKKMSERSFHLVELTLHLSISVERAIFSVKNIMIYT